MGEKTIRIELPTDEDEMLPRQCPNCDGKFAIDLETYQDQHYLNLRCPYCEFIEEFDEFLTEEQAEYRKTVGTNEAFKMAEKEVKKMLEKEFGKTRSSGLFSKKALPSPKLPIDTQEITCSECGFHYLADEERDPQDVSCPVCR